MELHCPLPRSLSPLRICGLLFCLALLAGAASAASTDLKVVKLASDGKTVIAERTVDYRWLEANLPVKGDGSTHYYHQGPTFDDADLWDPTESKNVEDKDMGAVKGTALRDLCGLAGGMSPGDALLVRSGDGFSKRFSYGSVYSPSARQGQMVLTWFRAGEGYVPSYSTGMRVVFFADTSTNPWGKHVFGNADMKASMPSSEWHYFNGVYPTTTGLSIQSVSELRILSTQPAATTTAATTATTKPTTVTVTPAKSPTATAQATPQGTASATTKPATTTGNTPTGTSVQPTVSAGTGIVTVSTVPSATVATVASVVTAPYDDGGSVIVTTMPTATATAGATATTAPPTTDAGNTTVQTPDANATATANATASPTDSPVPTPTGYDHTYDYSISTGLDYTADFEEIATSTATPTPTVAATATEPVPASPVVTAPPSLVPSPSPTSTPEDRASTRSLSFTLSFQVRESGNGPAVAVAPPGSTAIVSPASPLGGLWAFLKAVARLIDPFFT